MEQLVGHLASVTTRIRGGDLPGEVMIRYGGDTHVFLAYANQEIPTGTEVLIVNSRGGHQVDVEAWRTPGLGLPPPAPTTS